MPFTYLSVLCYFCFVLSFTLGIVEPDFGRLNIRVGKILEVMCHPRYPKLALIRTDFVENSPKIILSDLYTHKITLGHLRNKKTLFLMNMVEPQTYNISYAPGEHSDGMLLLAYDGKNVDILDVPSHAVPGDTVEVDGYKYRPDPQLDPEDFEKISSNLRIDSMNVATYKNIPLTIRGEGSITTRVIFDCAIIAV